MVDKLHTPQEVAGLIAKIILALRTEGSRSEGLIEAKARAMSVYDKALGVRSLEHHDGGMKVTMIKDQAKADAHQLLMEKIVAEESLKAHYTRLDTLKAQLNGWQSVNRYLETITR